MRAVEVLGNEFVADAWVRGFAAAAGAAGVEAEEDCVAWFCYCYTGAYSADVA